MERTTQLDLFMPIQMETSSPANFDEHRAKQPRREPLVVPSMNRASMSHIETFFVSTMFLDLIINTFAERFRQNPYVYITLYGIQGLGVVANLVLLVLSFVTMTPFKAGLLRVLVNCSCLFGSCWKRGPRGEFNLPFYTTILYLSFVCVTRIWESILIWPCQNGGTCDPWSVTPFRVIYIFFRVLAVVYYVVMKRASVMLMDTKYYNVESVWLRDRLGAVWADP